MKVLMCPPIHFEVLDENPNINPWMKKAIQPDRSLALRQWLDLYDAYLKLGVEVLTIQAEPGLGDMCFTANSAWGRDNIFVLANYHSAIWWRQGEVQLTARWLVERGKGAIFLPKDRYFEGQGSLATISTDRKRRYVLGWGIRESEEVADWIEDKFRLESRIVPVQLIDPRCYHLDVSLHFARGASSIIWVPEAFDRQDVKRIERMIGQMGLESLELSIKEAIQDKGNNRINFLVNAVYIGNTEIMTWDEEYSEFPPRVRRFIESRGAKIIPVNLSEFGTSGGGARCLSLFLE